MFNTTGNALQKALLNPWLNVLIVEHVSAKLDLKHSPEESTFRVEDRDWSHLLWMTRIFTLRQQPNAADLKVHRDTAFNLESLEQNSKVISESLRTFCR